MALQIENLTSFRGKQPMLDLRECELFAIAGPTGSGKTSLLDAIVFALYGHIPRVGKGCSEMISLGGDRLSVVLDFSLGGRPYRVTRVLRRGKSADAQIEDISTGDPRPIADGVRAVDAEVGRLIGLNVDAFVQCVVLPQGEFARFLKSTAGERRDILRRLLQLTVYEQMRVRAAQDADESASQIATRREFLVQHLSDATPEAVAALEMELANVTSLNASRGNELASQEKALERLREQNRLTREILEARGALRALDARKEDVERDEARARDAARAAGVVPHLDAAERASERARLSHAQAAAARAERDEATDKHEVSCRALDLATKNALELPTLDAQLSRLTAAVALLAPTRKARERVSKANESLRQLETQIALAEASVREADAAAAAATDDSRRFLAAIDEIQYDDPRHRRLRPLATTAAAVAAERRSLDRFLEGKRAAEERERVLVSQAQRMESLADQAEQRLAEAQERHDAAEQALDEATRKDHAVHLRTALRPGDTCPVCEQVMSHVPMGVSAVALAEVSAVLQASEDALDAARSAASQARSDSSAAKAKSAEATLVADKARADEASGRDRLSALVSDLAAKAGADLDVSGSDLPETVLSMEIATLDALRDRHADAVTRHADAEKRLAALTADVAQKRQQLASLSEAALKQRAELDRATDDARSLEVQLAASGSPDPEREHASVAARRKAIQHALENARTTESERRETLGAARAKVTETERVSMADAEAARTAERVAEETLRSGGFTSSASARAAFLTVEQLEILQRTCREYYQKRQTLSSRAAELKKSLGGEEVDDSTLDAASRDATLRRAEHAASLEAQTRLDQRLVELRKRAAQAGQFTDEIAVLERRFGTQKQLANDLGGPKFQEFLLRQILRDLTDGASVRLQTLTGRYGFDLDDNDFVVIDYDSAGERRSADTLSGGETFLASLALALELSEQIRRSAGALDLDSLFIDEGFGTLDPETLDTVASAIEGLKVSGRMVGVITHIQELTSRFPVQLHVAKGPEGARVEVRHA